MPRARPPEVGALLVKRVASSRNGPALGSLALSIAVLSACRRESGSPPLRGHLVAAPPLLIAPPADRPDGVLHGRLSFTCEQAIPAGASLRVVQGVSENGRFLGGEELRYGLPPVRDAGGRALGVGARLLDRATSRTIALLPVAPLPPEKGWLEIQLEHEWPTTAAVELLLGDPQKSGVGPPSSTLPVEVELAAELRLPDASAPLPLEGRVPVRIAPEEADWLRVLVPAQSREGAPARATVVFMSGFSGPQRSSLDARLRAGTLQVSGPFPAFDVKVEDEPPSDAPRAVALELPPLPRGVHRIGVRFLGERPLRGLSNPIRVGGETTPTFFGSLHAHTRMGGHATGTPSRALRYAREIAALDFVALSEHRESSDFDGAWLMELAARESRPDRFVVFTAWEWTDPRSGHRHVVSRTPRDPPLEPPDLASFAATVARDPDLLVIAHHPLWNGGTAQRAYDWGEPGALPRQLLAEAYSWHGCSFEHDSDFPLHGNHDQEFPPEAHSDVLSALARGHRLFLLADGDDHLGKPGCLVGIEWPKSRRYAWHGLVAARAPALDRDSLFRALESGAVYGTTGARLLVDARRSPRGASISIAATAPLARVVLRTPTARLAERSFEPVAFDLGASDAPLFLDPAKGTWDVELELDAASAGAEATTEGGEDPATQPWIVEVAQQDLHHAWLLLPPDSWKK
jgi:hypothetical protein